MVAGIGLVMTLIAVVHLTVTVNRHKSLNFVPVVHRFSVATIFKLYTPFVSAAPCVITNF